MDEFPASLLRDRTSPENIVPCSGGPCPTRSRSLNGFSQAMRRLTLCSDAYLVPFFNFSRWSRPSSTLCLVITGTAACVLGSFSTFAILAGTLSGIHGLLLEGVATVHKRYSDGSSLLRESVLSFRLLPSRLCWHQRPL